VNGNLPSGAVEGRTLALASFLRDNLSPPLARTSGLRNTSQCGPALVHVNGEGSRPATMLAARPKAQTSRPRIRGKSRNGSLTVIQQAFQDHHGLQCGFLARRANDHVLRRRF